MRARGDAVPGDLRPDPTPVDWIAAEAALDACDAYVVVVADPQTGDIDTYGPYDGLAAVEAADAARLRCDTEGLEDMVVRVTRMHLRAGSRPV